MKASSPRGPTNAQVLLGLFIVWQLFYLLASNSMKLMDEARSQFRDNAVVEAVAPGWAEKTGHIYDAETVLSSVTNRWAQLTAQPQNWKLFSPNIFPHVTFLGVEMRWDEDINSAPVVARQLAPLMGGSCLDALTTGAVASVNPQRTPAPIYLPSENEPADPRCFFRIGKFRLRKYESYIDVVLARGPPDSREPLDAWREKIERKLRREGDTIHAYLRWRLRTFQRDHPGLPPPKQVVLRVRHYTIPAPEEAPQPWMWQEVHVALAYPFARWRPEIDAPDGYLSVEMYNPVIGRFQYVTK
jgi:hypothetical protein